MKVSFISDSYKRDDCNILSRALLYLAMAIQENQNVSCADFGSKLSGASLSQPILLSVQRD